MKLRRFYNFVTIPSVIKRVTLLANPDGETQDVAFVEVDTSQDLPISLDSVPTLKELLTAGIPPQTVNKVLRPTDPEVLQSLNNQYLQIYKQQLDDAIRNRPEEVPEQEN